MGERAIEKSMAVMTSVKQTQLVEELRVALGRTPPSDLAEWGKRSAKRFVSTGVKRVTGFGSLLATITTLSADELTRAISAMNDRTFGEYASDRAGKAQQLVTLVVERGQSAFDLAAKTFESRPSEAATHLLSLVVGFYCGSGGDGDGGIPDLDLLAGIGAHRSIFTHSIIAGTFVETAVMSLVDLIQVVHAQLPPRHNDFWDSMLRHAEIGGSTFVSGASIGIATHLGVDTMLDGFTPYKDLPIELPQFAHELLMGLNAGMEGVHGVRRYGQDVEQLGAKVDGSETSRVDAVVVSYGKLPDRELVPRALENKMSNPDRKLDSTPVDEYVAVADLAGRVHRALGIDVAPVTEAIDAARKRIDQASGPFCLGVIGEFRVGKSTLINALMGREVAFTDFLEATPVICRFIKGSRLGATIIFNDGQAESMSVEECNSILDERRHDKEWAAGVTRVEYQVPSDALDSFDLWDAPGLGGSEDNDRLAQHYLDMLGGAIWVMDATLIGKAAIANPVARMHADGKPIVCVLNRIDETDEDHETLKSWVSKAYPGVFKEIVTFSAQSALDATVDGNLSAASLALWNIINDAIGVGAEAGSATRASLAAGNGNAVLATELENLSRSIQDRIGALEHFRTGLETAKQQSVKVVSAHLDQRAESIFGELKNRVHGELAKANWSPASIDKIMALLSDSEMLSEISGRVATEAVELVNQTWLSASEHALVISESAVPLNNIVTYYKMDKPSQANDTKAIEHGVYVGGMTAIGAGTIAAISTIVTWPVILAAVPVGALAMWKKRRDIRVSESELLGEIDGLISRMKRGFLEQARPEIESRLGAAIQVEVDRLLADKRSLLLKGADPLDAVELMGEVGAVKSALHVHDSSAEPTEWTGAMVLQHLQNPGTRLDMVVQTLDFSLAPILADLPATTEIRLIINANGQDHRELEKRVAEAFENWPGRKRVKAISASRDIDLSTMLLTQDRCLVSESNLGRLLERSTHFVEFDGGRLAGQHLFATLWEGNPFRGVAIEAFPVH